MQILLIDAEQDNQQITLLCRVRFLYFYLFIQSDHLKPIAAEERRIEEEEKKAREEQERIAKQLAEGLHTS